MYQQFSCLLLLVTLVLLISITLKCVEHYIQYKIITKNKKIYSIQIEVPPSLFKCVKHYIQYELKYNHLIIISCQRLLFIETSSDNSQQSKYCK